MKRTAHLFCLLAFALTAFPLAAAGRPLAPRPLGPTSYLATGPETAWAAGRFLTVWYESVGLAGGHLFGAFHDGNGARLSSRALPIEGRWPPTWFELVGTGDSFVLFEQDPGGTRMVEIDAEGRVTGIRAVDLPPSSRAHVVWNGTHFLAALQSNAHSHTDVVVLDREGEVVLPPRSIQAHQTQVHVAPAGNDRFIVAAVGEVGVFRHEVTAEGIGPRTTVRGPRQFASDPHPIRVLAVPLSDGNALVIWSSVGAQSSELRSVVVHRDGTVGAESVLTSHMTPLTPLEAIRSGNGYVLAYASDRGPETDALRTLRLDETGKPAGEPLLIASALLDNGAARSAAAGTAAILVTYMSPQYAIWSISAGSPARAPELLSIREAHQTQPILGAGHGEVLALWHDRMGNDAAVRAAAVDADGVPRAAGQISQPYLLTRETAWNGTHHLVVHGGRNHLLATRVTAAGAVVDATPVVLAQLPEISFPDTAVVWAGTRWVVVWTDVTGLYSMTVSRDGVPSAAQRLDVLVPIPMDWTRGITIPALAFDGEHVLLVWSEWQQEDCFQFCFIAVDTTYAVRLTSNGDPVDAIPVDLGIVNPQSLSVASSGSEFLVAADRHGAILQSGSTSLRVIMTPRPLFSTEATSDVTWDGASYVVAFRYYGWHAQWYVALLRLNRGGHASAAPAGTPTLQPYLLQALPSVAAPFAGNAMIGVEEGTAADGVRAVVYRERDLTPLPPPPAPPRNVRVSMLAPQSYEVSWDPSATANPDAYVVEKLTGNTWSLVIRVPGHITRAEVSAFDSPVFRLRAIGFGGSSIEADTRSGQPRRRSVR